MSDSAWSEAWEFLSTPSARRATQNAPARWPGRGISIHALREEGDALHPTLTSGKSIFLSTPSARRATFGTYLLHPSTVISIHALREEGDTAPQHIPATLTHFYPRPPRGGRLDDPTVGAFGNIFLSTPSARRATPLQISAARLPANFYPRPPRGGRRKATVTKTFTFTFLSTPSARRATQTRKAHKGGKEISIHALREEGD